MFRILRARTSLGTCVSTRRWACRSEVLEFLLHGISASNTGWIGNQKNSSQEPIFAVHKTAIPGDPDNTPREKRGNPVVIVEDPPNRAIRTTVNQLATRGTSNHITCSSLEEGEIENATGTEDRATLHSGSSLDNYQFLAVKQAADSKNCS